MVEVGMQLGIVLSSSLFAVVVYAVTRLVTGICKGSLLLTDYSIITGEAIKRFGIIFRKWRQVAESMDLRIILGLTKVMH